MSKPSKNKRAPAPIFTIRLGPHRYPVRLAKKLPGNLGETNRNHNTITLSNDQCPTNQASTLIHEILHAIFNSTPARHTAGWSDSTEEYIVESLETGLLELFTRNPEAVAWLVAASERQRSVRVH